MKELSVIPEIVDSVAKSDWKEYSLSSLTIDEIQLRKNLENQIAEGLKLSMQGFYLIGTALRKIKSLKLHRDTHQRFDEYAKERFHISKRYQHYLINAVEVIDVMKDDEQYFEQIKGRLPEREFHCRELLKLGYEPLMWKKAWEKSLTEAGGKFPAAKTVRLVVGQLKNLTLEHNPFEVGDICLINAADNLKLRGLQGCWAIIIAKSEYYCDIKTSLGFVPQIPSQHLLHSAYTQQQQEQIKKICTLLEQIPSYIRKEEAVIALLKVIGHRFVLSDIEADLLTTLLSTTKAN